ncbi:MULTISPECIES: hypothetical protein [Halorussus]|uniref:hypothetical protein n=1 Tax=Halorussus TaxID=1070314 RepID=UPI00209DBCFE|nr:hypothetical protein [Halorussus vallis]USZ76122.1 hypothetical protein NGM07_02065 [Halorussus vallis]
MLRRFPYEAEPDGAVFGPHHFYLGVLLILLVCWMVYGVDESGRKPWGVVALTMLAIFFFSLTWPYYPAVGALGVLVTLGIAAALAALRPYWWRVGMTTHWALLVGLFVALDDAVSHALGWRTPLDSIWAEYLYPYVSKGRLPSDLETFVAENLANALGVVPL